MGLLVEFLFFLLDHVRVTALEFPAFLNPLLVPPTLALFALFLQHLSIHFGCFAGNSVPGTDDDVCSSAPTLSHGDLVGFRNIARNMAVLYSFVFVSIHCQT